jgi:hypothetical protein
MAKQRPRHPEGRALQYEDLDPEGRRSAREQWGEIGNVSTRLEGARAAARAAIAEPGVKAEYKQKQEHRLSSLETVAPHLKDKPMTLQGAAAARVQRVQQGRERTRAAGGGDLGGADFYFQHHNLIAAAGQKHGFSPHEAITATTGLSPLNAPQTERPAGAAAMKLTAEPHSVEISPELHQATRGPIKRMGKAWQGQGLGEVPPLSKEHIGQEVKVQDLHPVHVAAIGSVNARMRNQGTPIKSSAPEAFASMGATRLSDEISKSIGHLRGDVPEEETISHHGAPKVHTYKEVTKMAVPNSPEHAEFAIRMHHFIHGDPNQTVMDLFGLRHSQEGVLSSDAPTPEDTWQQAISTRQTPLNVPGSRGRGVSVSKTAGSDPHLAAADAMRKTSASGATLPDDPRITGVAASHALNNKATRMAAQKIKIQMGDESTNMPAQAVQAMGWTEERRQAEKDPEYKLSQMAAQHRGQVSGRQFRGQGRMISPKLPVTGDQPQERREVVTPAAKPPKQYRAKES